MAYTTFTGRDGQQATFSWVTQKIGGFDASVLVLDVNGAPLSTANPLPITAPSNLPVAVQGTAAVDQVVLGGALSASTVAGNLIASATVKTATSGRKVIYVSNGGTVGVWLGFGATAAIVGQGVYLPPGSNEPFPYAGEVRVISATGAAAGPVGYVEF